jgi:hypothetical protein
MRTTPNKAEAERTLWKRTNAKPLDIAAASVPDALAALHVNNSATLLVLPSLYRWVEERRLRT